MSTFIQDLIRDNKNATWFIMYHFLNTHTALAFVKGIIVRSDFCLAISLFFICDVLAICILGT